MLLEEDYVFQFALFFRNVTLYVLVSELTHFTIITFTKPGSIFNPDNSVHGETLWLGTQS